MFTSIKIALNYMKADKKKAMLTGVAIFFSALFLFVTSFTMNGIEKQVTNRYKNLQTGDVIAMWNSLDEIDPMDSGKFLGKPGTFDIEDDTKNLVAIDAFNKFNKEHSSQLKAVYPIIRRYLYYSSENDTNNEKNGRLLCYSLSKEHAQHILDTGALEIEEGSMYSEDGKVCISREVADGSNLEIGDTIELTAYTVDGESNIQKIQIGGIYANAAGYDNLYIFMTEDDAHSLFKFHDDYFDVALMYINNEMDIDEYANKLNDTLDKANGNLRARSYEEASTFFTSTSKNLKFIFQVFTCVLLILIGFGLYTSIKMKIQDRIRIFGTLRAIGYSRLQCFMILFNEVAILTVIASVLAFIVSVIFVIAFQKNGIYVGSGGITYALGGERFYPKFKLLDVVVSSLIMFAFSLAASAKPACELVRQNIADLLSKRIKKRMNRKQRKMIEESCAQAVRMVQDKSNGSV